MVVSREITVYYLGSNSALKILQSETIVRTSFSVTYNLYMKRLKEDQVARILRRPKLPAFFYTLWVPLADLSYASVGQWWLRRAHPCSYVRADELDGLRLEDQMARSKDP